MLTARPARASSTPLARAQVWSSTLGHGARRPTSPARDYVELVIGNVASETEIGVLQRLLLRAASAAERYADPANRDALLARLAGHARELLVARSSRVATTSSPWSATGPPPPAPTRASSPTCAACSTASSTFDGVVLDTDLRWHLLTALARAGAADEADIAAELERDDTDLGQRQAATARAARRTLEAKEAAWSRLLEDTDAVAHRVPPRLGRVQPARPGRAARARSPRATSRSLDDVWRGTLARLGPGVLPGHVPAVGRRHRPARARSTTRCRRDDLPRPLRRVLLEQRDTLVRTSRPAICDAAALSDAATPT